MDRLKMKPCFVILCALITCIAASDLQAALMHPSVMGDTVTFSGIEESSPTGDPVPLYGPPSASGDNLDFPTTGNFRAFSQNGDPGADLTDGKLNVMITSKFNQGFFINSLHFSESGLVTLFKPPASDDDPFAQVTGLVDIDIVEVDGVAITPIELHGLQLDFTPSAGTFQHSVDNDVVGVDSPANIPGPSFGTGWNGGLSVNLHDILVENQVDFWEGVTKVNITLDNTLLASTTQNGSIAFIDKKDFDITVDTERDPKIPEPATALLIGLASATAVAINRRRARH